MKINFLGLKNHNLIFQLPFRWLETKQAYSILSISISFFKKEKIEKTNYFDKKKKKKGHAKASPRAWPFLEMGQAC